MLCFTRCSLLLSAMFLQANHGFITDNVDKIVDRLWVYVAAGRILVTSPQLDLFLARYDENSKAWLDLIECDFKMGTESWVKDFEDLGVNQEYAAAYFKTLDVRGNGLVSRLSIEDLDELVDICERHAKRCQHDCQGFLKEGEFKQGFKEVVFRSLPFTLIFVRSSRSLQVASLDCDLEDSTLRFKAHRRTSGLLGRRFTRQPILEPEYEFQYEKLSLEAWGRLFFIIANSGNEDGHMEIEITKNNLSQFWTNGKYGPRDKAEDLFNVLVDEDANAIYYDTWNEIFQELDCRDNDKSLDIMEFLQLDLLVHGSKVRGDGNCFLKRN